MLTHLLLLLSFGCPWLLLNPMLTQCSAVQGAYECDTQGRLDEIVSKFEACADAKQRYQLVLQFAESLPAYPEELKRNENRVLGCSAQVRNCNRYSWSATGSQAVKTGPQVCVATCPHLPK